MGSNRYEVKRGLNFTEIPTNTVVGSFGAVIKALDIQNFDTQALFENWNGLVSGTDIESADVNTNDYHDFGAVWGVGVNGATAETTVVGNYVSLLTGTASGNDVCLGAVKPFYLNRHSSWNAAVNGVVFEALAKMTATESTVFDAFVGMVNKTDPTATADAYDGKTVAVNRFGFSHSGSAQVFYLLSASGSGVTQTYLGTTTVDDVSALTHFKTRITSTEYTANGTTFSTGIEYFVNNNLVGVVCGTAGYFPATGEVPYYPWFYIESQANSDPMNMSVYGVRVWYF